MKIDDNNSSSNKRAINSYSNLETFYSEKRNDGTNVFSVISTSELSNKEERDMNDSFYIPTDDEKTHKIFDDVISYKNQQSKKNNVKNNITDEILAIDLPNDDVFVKDVIESYEESFSMPKNISQNEERKLLTLTNELDLDSNTLQKRPSFTEFVSTKPVNERDSHDDRFNSFKASLENAYANQDELHKSIQIALDDVKKHRDVDLVVDDTTSVNNHDDDSKSIAIESIGNSSVNDNDDYFSTPNNETYAINFKAKDDNFYFVDNTANSKRFSNNLTTLQSVEPTVESNITEERIKELVQEEVAKIQQTQKIYDEVEAQNNLEAQTRMIEKTQEELALERQKVLEEAQNERDQLLASAKNEIELERERLKYEQEQYEQLKNQLEYRIQENKEFIEKQRLALLEAAQKEKERLINNARAERQNSQEDILNEIKVALHELRNNQVNPTKKIELAEETTVKNQSNPNEEYKKIFNELSEKLDDIQKNITVAIKPEVMDSDLEEPTNENRSYTEKIIDVVEADDYVSEEIIPIPTIPLEFVNQRSEARTTEVNSDVDVMRRALKNSHQTNEFNFEEKRNAYEREKVKEEIKREILQEMSMLTNNAVGLNTTIPAIDLENESVTSSIQETTEIQAPKKDVTLHSSNKIPELANRNFSNTTNFATKMYDFDLFNDLGLEPFEIIPTKKINENKTATLPINIKNEALTSQFNRPEFSIFGDELNSKPTEPEKPNLRKARLTFNKKNDDNLSSSELIKSIAKEIKRKSNSKK